MKFQRKAAQLQHSPHPWEEEGFSPAVVLCREPLSSSSWLFDLSEHSHNLNIYNIYFPVLSWIFGNVQSLLFGSSSQCCCRCRGRAGSPWQRLIWYPDPPFHPEQSWGQPMDFSSLSLTLSDRIFVFSVFPISGPVRSCYWQSKLLHSL